MLSGGTSLAAMVPQNGQQPRPHQQQPSFPNMFSQGSQGTIDASFIDSPQTAKQFAAMAATNQARSSQNSRPVPSSAGTSSGPFGAAVHNPHGYPSGAHDLLGSSTNGHTNFAITNNFSLAHNPSVTGNAPFLEQGNMARSGLAMKDPLKQREHGFLQGLATAFAKHGHPLPPALTGISFPNYDPSATPWSNIEPGSEIGTVKLVGKDVNLFRLWGLAIQQGGAQAIENAKAWPAFLPHLGLPEEYMDPQTSSPIPVAKLLRDFYMTILGPFEQMYRKNMHDQQKKLQMSQNQALGDPQFLVRQNAGMSGLPQGGVRPMSSNGIMPQPMSGTNGLGQFLPVGNQQRPTLAAGDSLTPDLDTLPRPAEVNLLEQDIQGNKRKHDNDGIETKRVRQKTDPPDTNPILVDVANNVPSRPESQPAANGATNRPRQQPMRRKIEYVPLAREVDTYGGRDVHAIDAEWTNQMSRRLLRDIHEWGVVDTEHLSMSLRSRLAIELSYALTTFTVLSTMRAQTPGSGFPIANCPELLDDALDLMEDTAFGGPETWSESPFSETYHKIYTNRELVTLVQEGESRPFAPLQPHQGSKDPALGPMQRPGNIILSVVAIVRNLSVISDNIEFLASFPRLADRLLRLCMLKQFDGSPPTAASLNMSLADLLLVRREIMFIFVNLSGFINLSALPNSTATRIGRRIFELIASYLVDPIDSVPPLAAVQLSGVVPTSLLRPPALADTALEVFTRISQNDVNRQLLAKSVPQRVLCQLITSLVHRVPMIEADFLLMQRDYWQSYVEKTIMGIYSLIFMAPYELKQTIKADKSLGIKTVLLRMAQRVLLVPNHDGRGFFVIPARRAVEAMRLLDKAEEKEDAAEPAMPGLRFGMGFADGEDKSLDKGTGLLGANKDVAWEMLMMHEVLTDEVFFNELDSLVRVDCP